MLRVNDYIYVGRIFFFLDMNREKGPEARESLQPFGLKSSLVTGQLSV